MIERMKTRMSRDIRLVVTAVLSVAIISSCGGSKDETVAGGNVSESSDQHLTMYSSDLYSIAQESIRATSWEPKDIQAWVRPHVDLTNRSDHYVIWSLPWFLVDPGDDYRMFRDWTDDASGLILHCYESNLGERAELVELVKRELNQRVRFETVDGQTVPLYDDGQEASVPVELIEQAEAVDCETEIYDAISYGQNGPLMFLATRSADETASFTEGLGEIMRSVAEDRCAAYIEADRHDGSCFHEDPSAAQELISRLRAHVLKHQEVLDLVTHAS